MAPQPFPSLQTFVALVAQARRLTQNVRGLLLAEPIIPLGTAAAVAAWTNALLEVVDPAHQTALLLAGTGLRGGQVPRLSGWPAIILPALLRVAVAFDALLAHWQWEGLRGAESFLICRAQMVRRRRNSIRPSPGVALLTWDWPPKPIPAKLLDNLDGAAAFLARLLPETSEAKSSVTWTKAATLASFAKQIGCHRNTLSRRIHEGTILARRLGRLYQLDASAIPDGR
jgi:hypothetical protein